MLYIAICAGSISANRQLLEQNQQLLEERKIPATVDTFSSDSELAGILARNPLRYDLLFLDADRAVENARKLRNLNLPAAIILVADTPALAVDGYRVGATRYLLNPISHDTLDDIYSELAQRHCIRRLAVDTDNALELLEFDHILFLQTKGRIAEIVLAERRIQCPETLSGLLSHLPPAQFARTHQSYVVNLRYVDRLTKAAAILTNGQEILVSRRLHAALEDRLRRYGILLG